MRLLASGLILLLLTTSGHAQSDSDLANKISNPVSDLISVPFNTTMTAVSACSMRRGTR